MNFRAKFIIVLLLFADFNFVFAQGLTFVTNTYSVGPFPHFVTTADVNGDGKLDLIVANSGTNTLAILTNNGNGLFGSNATYTVGGSPSSVCATDINSDGKLDLICANITAMLPSDYSGALTVLTNDGTGMFGSNATYTVSGAPTSVVAADINNDGKPDLICAIAGNFPSMGTLLVLTNNGAGVFGSNATLNVGNNSYPTCVVAADVNGDGKVDLISANQGANTLTVFTNDGFGNFKLSATLAVGNSPTCVVVADVNGDGKPDLITANFFGGTLTVLTNNGSGVFGSNATIYVNDEPRAVAAADLNNDGKIDLISANWTNNMLMVFTNNGSGVFGSNATLSVGLAPFWVTAADVNNDDKIDLISANNVSYSVSVLRQTVLLDVIQTETNLIVSWPYSPEYELQTNSDLISANWSNAGYEVFTNGLTESVIIASPLQSELFFRLQHP